MFTAQISNQPQSQHLGYWTPDGTAPATGVDSLQRAFDRLDQPFYLLHTAEGLAVGEGGIGTLDSASINGHDAQSTDRFPMAAYIPALPIERLGDPSFISDFKLKYAYVAGAMANGLATEELVEAMARAGMLGFFGSAGLPLPRVEAAVDRLQKNLRTADGYLPHGFNLIHSPSEPKLEAGVVDLYLRRGVHLAEASAYLRLTLPLIRFRVAGIRCDASGRIVTPNRVVAKVSRIEVARRFFSPPDEKFLRALVESGDITADQAKLAESIPVAQDLTAEADSGGHTDNQPFVTLLPTMLALRDELQEKFKYEQPLRVGAAGGIGTPASAAAAFSMGAAYVLTGSVNQACQESGASPIVREMLCATQQADVAMAPAADMFEMGVKVQVLKRGTMFPMRAAKLYEIFRTHNSLDELPPATLAQLEKEYLRAPVAEIWDQTRAFFSERDPTQLERADRDSKHKMALIFRWYLGLSSYWANAGDPTRKVDYQIWCGPAMGAFNEWVKGTFLENVAERRVASVALNLLHGAAVLLRLQIARAQGAHLPASLGRIAPRTFS
jgi:trans-AT polyketide synthase/acyltransferase/oxidoreductase domain-containing protein